MILKMRHIADFKLFFEQVFTVIIIIFNIFYGQNNSLLLDKVHTLIIIWHCIVALLYK